jgi:thiamine pyrophosphate-dependent acetolactate synthase large subunit-like protein
MAWATALTSWLRHWKMRESSGEETLQLSKRSGDHYADWGLIFGNPDFVACAQSYGAGGSVVTAANDLVPVLEAAFAAGGVQLVAVPLTIPRTFGSSSRSSARSTPAAVVERA